jgi:ApaG protein
MAESSTVYSIENNGYKIQVRTGFDLDRSNVLKGQFLFSYQITITNCGGQAAQLMSREWHIKDAHGHVRLVQGPGVVGYTPVFGIGESFDYQSFCPLATMNGSMWGSFTMKNHQGEEFRIKTPVFEFSVPEDLIDRY